MSCVPNILSLEDQHSVIKQYLQSDEFQVLSYKEKRVSNGGSAHTAVHFKILVKDTPHEVKFLVKAAKDSKEMVWYKNIFSHPTFHSDFSSKFYLVNKGQALALEDLSEKGFTAPERYDLEHLKVALQLLAKYHAGSVSFEEEESDKLGRRFNLTEKYPEFKATNFELLESLKSLHEVIDRRSERNLSNTEFKQRLLKLTEDLENKNWCNFRRVLCHGSLWGSNVLFKYENGVPVDCKITNFESQHYTPAAFDVLQLIYLNTPQEFRKHHLHNLLKVYYSSLRNELLQKNIKVEEVLPLMEDFEVSVNEVLPYMKIQKTYFYLNKQSQVNQNDVIDECLFELEDLLTHPTITIEDCFKIVKNKLKTTDYDLLGHKIMPLAGVCGFAGDHNLLKIDVLVNGQKLTLNFFAKLMPKTAAGMAFVTDSNAFQREIFYYHEYFPMLQNLGLDIVNDFIVPCHFARWNDVLIFDDLSMLNYATLYIREGCDIELVKMLIDNIAKMHACSLIFEERLGNATRSTYRFNEHFPMAIDEALFITQDNHAGHGWAKAGIKAIDFKLELFPDVNSPLTDEELKPKIKKAVEKLYELIQPSKQFRNVVCHGDLWASNIFVQTANGYPKDCRFIDWQICRYCPPAHDLLMFLYVTTNRETRKQHLGDFIAFYHNQLGKYLKKYGHNIDEIYPYEVFQESVDHMIPQVVTQAVLYSHLIYLRPDIGKTFMADDEKWNATYKEDRRNLLTYVIEHDAFHAERLKEAIEDLREMCIKYY